jgi:hypothetical protein
LTEWLIKTRPADERVLEASGVNWDFAFGVAFGTLHLHAPLMDLLTIHANSIGGRYAQADFASLSGQHSDADTAIDHDCFTDTPRNY